jgi:DUF1365 family protein
MDMKYVTPFLLIAAAYCWQILDPAPALTQAAAGSPSYEFAVRFTGI